jgi:hypothetical protein
MSLKLLACGRLFRLSLPVQQRFEQLLPETLLIDQEVEEDDVNLISPELQLCRRDIAAHEAYPGLRQGRRCGEGQPVQRALRMRTRRCSSAASACGSAPGRGIRPTRSSPAAIGIPLWQHATAMAGRFRPAA